MKVPFTSVVTPPADNHGPAYWFIFNRFRVLAQTSQPEYKIPLIEDPADLGLSLVRSQYLGYLQQGEEVIHCYSGEVAEDTGTPDGLEFLGLRRLFGNISDEMLGLAGRAVQIKEWDRTHQYCGQCGSKVNKLAHERAKKCPQCGHTTYPRLSPAVIVSVERPSATGVGSELLLARNHRHPLGFFSVLAGFVEPGETLEGCVRREICEEVGIEVKNIRYFGSQPWPFPNSLMIAFTAEYASGDIRLEEEELSDAGWFAADDLPPVPPRVSIARQMIDAFVRRNSSRLEGP
ncbi:MAG: NAD(+) diphosphatase [Candidatus Promineifilaceae bacterium]